MEAVPWLTTAFALIGKMGVGGAWDSVSMTSVELFPTVVRWAIIVLSKTTEDDQITDYIEQSTMKRDWF